MNAYNRWKGARERKITQNHHRRRLVKQFSSRFLRLVVALMNNKDLERLRVTAEKKKQKQSKMVGRITFLLVELVPCSNLYLSACFGPLFFFNYRIKSSIRGSVLIRWQSSAHYPPPSQLACFRPAVTPTPHLFTLFTRYRLIMHIYAYNHRRAGEQPKWRHQIGHQQWKPYVWTCKNSELLDFKMKYKLNIKHKPSWCNRLFLVPSLGGKQTHIYPNTWKMSHCQGSE